MGVYYASTVVPTLSANYDTSFRKYGRVSSDNIQKDTRHQKRGETGSRRERLMDVYGCFNVPRRQCPRMERPAFNDTTTGATLKEARRVLKDAGARNISAITIAH